MLPPTMDEATRKWLASLHSISPTFQQADGDAETACYKTCPAFLATLQPGMREPMSDLLAAHQIWHDVALHVALSVPHASAGFPVLLQHALEQSCNEEAPVEAAGVYKALLAACEQAGGVPPGTAEVQSGYHSDIGVTAEDSDSQDSEGSNEDEALRRDRAISSWCKKRVKKYLTQLMQVDEADPFLSMECWEDVSPHGKETSSFIGLATMTSRLKSGAYDHPNGLIDLDKFWCQFQAIWDDAQQRCATQPMLLEKAKHMAKLAADVEDKFWEDMTAFEPKERKNSDSSSSKGGMARAPGAIYSRLSAFLPQSLFG